MLMIILLIYKYKVLVVYVIHDNKRNNLNPVSTKDFTTNN